MSNSTFDSDLKSSTFSDSSTNRFFINFCNNRGIRYNFSSVEHDLSSSKSLSKPLHHGGLYKVGQQKNATEVKLKIFGMLSIDHSANCVTKVGQLIRHS